MYVQVFVAELLEKICNMRRPMYVITMVLFVLLKLNLKFNCLKFQFPDRKNNVDILKEK